MFREHQKTWLAASLVIVAQGSVGCQAPLQPARIVFLDGAGHLGASASVETGLRKSGYRGAFDEFVWTSFLLWGTDHLITARSGAAAHKLAETITEQCRREPNGYVTVMGLSAGCNVILEALERLPDGVQVDYVVLFQPSVSSTRNLVPAMRHIKHKLLVTCSQNDGILALMLITADGTTDPPAGRSGFRLPPGLSSRDRAEYAKVELLPWRRTYERFGWDGGHVSSTTSQFVERVIVPRIRGRVRYVSTYNRASMSGRP